MIKRVYIMDLGGKLLDESCARKIKSLKPIESYMYNHCFVRILVFNLLPSIFTFSSMYQYITALVCCAWACSLVILMVIPPHCRIVIITTSAPLLPGISGA